MQVDVVSRFKRTGFLPKDLAYEGDRTATDLVSRWSFMRYAETWVDKGGPYHTNTLRIALFPKVFGFNFVAEPNGAFANLNDQKWTEVDQSSSKPVVTGPVIKISFGQDLARVHFWVSAEDDKKFGEWFGNDYGSRPMTMHKHTFEDLSVTGVQSASCQSEGFGELVLPLSLFEPRFLEPVFYKELDFAQNFKVADFEKRVDHEFVQAIELKDTKDLSTELSSSQDLLTVTSPLSVPKVTGQAFRKLFCCVIIIYCDEPL